MQALAQACRITPRQTEGPFFKPSSPERRALASSPTLVVSGRVLGKDCKPVAHALVDFWHADERGEYDNAGFRFRGHQFTDAEGRYRLETILPAEYPGRTRHIHAKLQARGGPVLTTQLYFPNEPRNASDGLFREELVVRTQKAGLVTFDFVAA
jgi:protocatechuate 3,4-dioxygenase beta subunit